MIPKRSTPIKNLILTDIFAKGRLRLNEIRIACHIIRYSWGYDRKERRQDWTKDITHQDIATGTGISRQTVTSTVKRMKAHGILKVSGKKYQFNEHYEDWLPGNGQSVKKTDSQETLQEMSEELTKNVRNLDLQQPSESILQSDCEIPKENNKENNKEKTYVWLVKLWNYLATKHEVIIEWRTSADIDQRLYSCLKDKLTKYEPREIGHAVLYYDKFMGLPDDKKKWQGYSWTLYEFLKHSKDNVARFKDWNVVVHNHVAPQRKEKNNRWGE